MKPERFRRTKSVVASAAIALVVAALTFGVSSAVLRPGSSPLVAPAGTAFTVSSAIYPSPACSGSTALLHPGVTDCAVLTIHNNLTVPITVQNMSPSVVSPPAGCPASDFSLPSYSGDLSVPASGTASTSGLPISLLDTGTNQDACRGVTVNFAVTGSAQFTDGTTIVLASRPNPPTSGQAVTLSATLTGDNPGSDPSPPTGTITFYRCPTAACTSTVSLGTGTVGAGGVATLTLSSLPAGTQFIGAAYGGQGSDYTASTSSTHTLNVAASAAGAGGSTPSNGMPGTSSKLPVAYSGADIAAMVAGGLFLIGAGFFLVLAARRRRRAAEGET